jgi:hypothetical protein
MLQTIGTIGVNDTGSTSQANASNQTVWIGTPTSNSVVQVAFSGEPSFTVKLSGLAPLPVKDTM